MTARSACLAWRWRRGAASAKRGAVAPRARPWSGFGPRHWVATGLAVCGLITLAALLGIYPRELSIPGIVSFHAIDTGAGETCRVTLTDGSTVSIGGESSLWITVTPRTRTVSMEDGEAFFQVAKDTQRPFTVNAGPTSVTALGTAFNVRRAGQRVVVAVSEGSVNVTAADVMADRAVPTNLGSSVVRSTRLSAGQQLSIDPARLPVAVVSIDVAAVGGWRDGRPVAGRSRATGVQYLNEPLANIVAAIRRYAARDIEIADPRIGELQVTGTIFEQSIDVWLMTLETMFPVRVVRDSSGRIRLETEE